MVLLNKSCFCKRVTYTIRTGELEGVGRRYLLRHVSSCLAVPLSGSLWSYPHSMWSRWLFLVASAYSLGQWGDTDTPGMNIWISSTREGTAWHWVLGTKLTCLNRVFLGFWVFFFYMAIKYLEFMEVALGHWGKKTLKNKLQFNFFNYYSDKKARIMRWKSEQ